MQAESGGLREKQVVPGCSSHPATMEKPGADKQTANENVPVGMDVEQPGVDPHLQGDTGMEKGKVSAEKGQANKGETAERKLLFSDVLKNKKDSGPGRKNAASFERRNVVTLYYGGQTIPDREYVGKKLLIDSLCFSAIHVYALIHIPGSRSFDISFRNSMFLDVFWARFEKVRFRQVWEGFTAIKVSHNTEKTVTILFSNETVLSNDIIYWLQSRVKSLEELCPIHDINDFWNGGYKVRVRLSTIGNEIIHLPNTLLIGRNRGFLFYPGQPRKCYKCGEQDHFSAACKQIICRNCGVTGHSTKECRENIRCNLCNEEGHYYINCPRSARNTAPENIITEEELADLTKEDVVAERDNQKEPQNPSSLDETVIEQGKEFLIVEENKTSKMEELGKEVGKNGDLREVSTEVVLVTETTTGGNENDMQLEGEGKPLDAPSASGLKKCDSKAKRYKGIREVSLQESDLGTEWHLEARSLRPKKPMLIEPPLEVVKKKKKKMGDGTQELNVPPPDEKLGKPGVQVDLGHKVTLVDSDPDNVVILETQRQSDSGTREEDMDESDFVTSSQIENIQVKRRLSLEDSELGEIEKETAPEEMETTKS
ncbi:zinc finger CCHC domain-containing protein 3-like [Latimeria chalumnae]|uniref:zinc finger CCHC domain-containing protein 3-like n=1 Tax=Latimeria chalumnae TaxID=7897 RepID=UPI00313B090E